MAERPRPVREQRAAQQLVNPPDGVVRLELGERAVDVLDVERVVARRDERLQLENTLALERATRARSLAVLESQLTELRTENQARLDLIDLLTQYFGIDLN